MRSSSSKGIPNWVIGLVGAFVLAIGGYLAFTKAVPWGGGTEYQVVFGSAQTLRFDSPVRIAGVEVGKVSSVEPMTPEESENLVSDTSVDGNGGNDATEAALVTLEINDEGLPLKEDATFKLRPRLFLEGNLFVELSPGSPSAPEADPDEAFPPSQTSGFVQLDQILTNALQSDVRRDLQVFLSEFGTALIDGGGAQSFRTLNKVSPGAFRYTAEVNEALLGQNPNDLSNLIKNLGKVVRGLGRNEVALQDTITNLRIVGGSFAAQSDALERAVVELPQVLDAADPAFTNLNAAFPSVRALSREILPGVRNSPETLDAATPLLRQVRLLSRKRELRGLARDLVPAIPPLARLTRRTPKFLEQTRALASCFNEVILPWSEDRVEGPPSYPYPAVGPVYKETAYGLAGIAGESRSGDSNGQYIRVAGGGGTNTVTIDEGGEKTAGVLQFPLEGSIPANSELNKPPFRPNAPCENQETPDLRASLGGTPTQGGAGGGGALPLSGKTGQILEDSRAAIDTLTEAATLGEEGPGSGAAKKQREANRMFREFYEEYGG